MAVFLELGSVAFGTTATDTDKLAVVMLSLEVTRGNKKPAML